MGPYGNRSNGRKILQRDRPSRMEDWSGGLEGAVAGSEEAARAARGVQLTCLRRCSLSSVSGRLTELPPEHLRLLGSLETLSSAPRPLPWQRRSAPPYPRGGVGSAPRPGGGTGSVFTGLRGYPLGRRHLAIAS